VSLKQGEWIGFSRIRYSKRSERNRGFDFKSEEDPSDLNHYVPKDQEKAWSAFLSDNDAEVKRLFAKRKAEVAELVSQYATKEPKVSVNSFRPKKFEDFEIVDENNKVVGHIRVKPSGVLWAPSNAKVWYGVSLKDFAAFIEQHGKKQVK